MGVRERDDNHNIWQEELNDKKNLKTSRENDGEKRSSTSLLAAAALSFELGAVTSANSQPVVPSTWFKAADVGWSAATTTTMKHGSSLQSMDKSMNLNKHNPVEKTELYTNFL